MPPGIEVMTLRVPTIGLFLPASGTKLAKALLGLDYFCQ